MDDSLFLCEIRAVHGVAAIVPDGTQHRIRAEFGPGVLPPRFNKIVARMSLRVETEEVVTIRDEAPDTLYPEAGRPEIILGTVLDEVQGVFVVDVGGVPFEVVGPEGKPPPSLGARVRCLLVGNARTRDVDLIY